MKDYIKNKLKRVQKYSVQGRGGHGGRSKDEKRAAAEAKSNRISANADRVTDTFSQLSPPFGADLLLGTAKLQSVELLSDGPIKGFFDQDGKQTDVLGATYINDVPIVSKTETRIRHKDLKLDNCQGCQLDYTTGVKRYLMDFRAYLSTGIGFTGRKEGFTRTNRYLDMAPAEMIFPSAKNYDPLFVARKDNLNYALGGDAGDRKHSIQFAANPGLDSNGNITSSFSQRKSNAKEFANVQGQGYRQSPYAQQSFYGQDQISSNSNFTIPSTNSYTNDRPLKYQGSVIAGGGLGTNGKVETAFVTRAFYNVLQGFFSSSSNITKFQTGYADKIICDIHNINDAEEFGRATGKDNNFGGVRNYNNGEISTTSRTRDNGTMGPLVGGDTPYITRHFKFHPGSEVPAGLIEPHITGIYNLLDQLPNQRELKSHIFKQSHEHAYRAFGVECTGTMHTSLTLGGQTNRSVLEFKGLKYSASSSDGTETHALDRSSSSVPFGTYIFFGLEDSWRGLGVIGNNVTASQSVNAGYYEQSIFDSAPIPLTNFTSGEKVRLTGSFYIPAGGKCSGLLFQELSANLRAPIFNYGSGKIIDARSTMDQWVDFDFTNQDADASGMNSTYGAFTVRMADFNNDFEALAQWDANGDPNGCMRENDGFFMKNLTIIREDVTGDLQGFNGGTTGYLIFPIDKYNFTDTLPSRTYPPQTGFSVDTIDEGMYEADDGRGPFGSYSEQGFQIVVGVQNVPFEQGGQGTQDAHYAGRMIDGGTGYWSNEFINSDGSAPSDDTTYDLAGVRSYAEFNFGLTGFNSNLGSTNADGFSPNKKLFKEIKIKVHHERHTSKLIKIVGFTTRVNTLQQPSDVNYNNTIRFGTYTWGEIVFHSADAISAVSGQHVTVPRGKTVTISDAGGQTITNIADSSTDATNAGTSAPAMAGSVNEPTFERGVTQNGDANLREYDNAFQHYRLWFLNRDNANGSYLRGSGNVAAIQDVQFIEDFNDPDHPFGPNNDRIKPNYNLNFSFGSGDGVVLGGETLKYVLQDVDGFSGIERSIRESIVLEVDLQGEGRDNRTSKLFNITGTTSAHNHIVALEENRPKGFKGAILYPVYLGEEGTALSGINDTQRLASLSRVMIFPNDDHEVKQLKYQSGIQYNYDVFSGMENGGICYSHMANPNIITTVNSYDAGLGGNIRLTGHGYPIQIRLQEREPTSFNFPNVYVASRDGQEVQTPLVSASRTEVPIGINLLGPYAFEQHENNSAIQGYNSILKINTGLANMGPGGSLRRSAFEVFDTSTYKTQITGVTPRGYVTGNYSRPSLSSADIEFDRNIDFNNWNEKPFTAADEVAAIHQIDRSEVNSISVVFQISALSTENIFEDDPDSPRVGRDKASLHLEVEVGFEGVDDSILPPQRTDITYEGITKNVYTVQTKDIILPTYDELLETSNESIENLKAKFKRYVKVRKLDYETLSTRIERQVSCYSIIEKVDCKFTYPFSALVQTELDARNFMDIPIRTFNTKLKKVLIPSNYFPLRIDGTDKRFIKNADSYQGDAKIYDGDWDGSFKFEWTDNPAWILYDLLTSNRYGIGNFLDDTEDVNIFNLYKIARYCDAVNNDGYFVGIPDGIGGLEPRYSANILINKADAAFEIINQITAIFNGNAFWANGVLDFYSDRPAKPAAFFNNGNVFDGHFTYQDVSKSSNFNCVSVQFQDKNDDFKIKTEVVEDEDGIRKDGKLVRELNGRGTTSRGQARRLAKYVLYSNKLEREIVNFKAGLEALMVNVGDIIEISDELKQFKIDGARVLQVNPGDPSIVIENTIDINSIDNEAFVYAPSGQTGKAEMYDEIRKGGLITNERLSGMDAQQVDKLQISSAVAEGDNGIKLNFTNVSGQSMSLIRTGSFANINLTNNESQTFRVIKIVPDDEQDIYSVMATEYNSGKFNFIEGNDENFNLSETTPFNIGIPDHTIKELTEPNSFSFTQTQNHIGTFDLNFTINGELNGNEEVYLISVVYPNGIRKEKRVKKSDETSGGYFVTETSFRNLEVFGTYNVFVKSDS